MCQPWAEDLSRLQLWGASLRPEGEGAGWLQTNSPPPSPPVAPGAVQRQDHVSSQLQSVPWSLSPRQKLAKDLIASALVPAGSSGRQWLPSASSALVVKDRHVATPCRQHRPTGGLSPLHCGIAIKESCEEPDSSWGRSSSNPAVPSEIETGATPCHSQGARAYNEAASAIASALQWSCPKELESACTIVHQQHNISPLGRALQAFSDEMFEGFEDIAQEDFGEWLADFNHLGESNLPQYALGKGCSRSSPDGHVASNVLWDTCSRNSVSSSVASTCVPASCQSLSDERGSSGHEAGPRCSLDRFFLAECVNDVSYPWMRRM